MYKYVGLVLFSAVTVLLSIVGLFANFDGSEVDTSAVITQKTPADSVAVAMTPLPTADEECLSGFYPELAIDHTVWEVVEANEDQVKFLIPPEADPEGSYAGVLVIRQDQLSLSMRWDAGGSSVLQNLPLAKDMIVDAQRAECTGEGPRIILGLDSRLYCAGDPRGGEWLSYITEELKAGGMGSPCKD